MIEATMTPATAIGICTGWGSFRARTVTACPKGITNNTVINALTPLILKLLSHFNDSIFIDFPRIWQALSRDLSKSFLSLSFKLAKTDFATFRL